ncbi:putative ankyrin repeat protein RF_0381 [Haliotis rubra]|uniref:putative ankyrin repeat protein RF_0381 n=1 Tax=Haliotis rubra TaxID=36100 RepID=UPI001EE62A86|nr:putative ankyrin repeat protein RF_0381 [Haliotis rubra]
MITFSTKTSGSCYSLYLKLQMSKGSLSSKACMKDGRCLVTRSGKETCVKDNRYLGTEELNRQSAENPTQESEKTQKKLLQAVKSGNLWSVKNILDSGLADINAKSRDGKTPILIAAGSGKRRVFELLMTNGADMCAVHKSLGTILHFAINGGNFDILKLIVRAHKVDINRGNGIGVTPLEWARCKHMKRMVAFLKHNGAAENPTQESEKAGKKLLQAVKSGSLQSVKNILDSGLADINAKSRDGKTPILIAAGSGKRRVFELLMTNGADMCAVDKSLGTILHFAVNGGNVDILKLILRAHRVDINRGNGLRVTPLEWARCRHRKQMVTLLKRNGGQPAFFDLFNDGQ